MSDIDYMKDVKARPKLLEVFAREIKSLNPEKVAGAALRSYGLAAMLSTYLNLPLVPLDDEVFTQMQRFGEKQWS